MLFLHTLQLCFKQLKKNDIQYIRIRQPYGTNAEVLLFPPLPNQLFRIEVHKFHQLSQLMKCRGFPSLKLKMEVPLNYDCGRSCRFIFTALFISLLLYFPGPFISQVNICGYFKAKALERLCHFSLILFIRFVKPAS